LLLQVLEQLIASVEELHLTEHAVELLFVFLVDAVAQSRAYIELLSLRVQQLVLVDLGRLRLVSP